MKSSKRLSIALIVVLGLAACATSPTGRRQLMLVSESQAIQASKQAYVQTIGKLQSEGKLAADPDLLNRVNGITSRLVAQAIVMRPDTQSWEWTVEVIDDPEMVNAWCMAGGRMAIYTGLINKLEATDDEIAQVMGHEISHALANHTSERMSIAMATQLGMVAAGVASDNSSVAVAGTALAATLALTLPNSRAGEAEADRIGIELAARAGYDPNAAVTLWRKMAKVGGSVPPQFPSTHPAPGNREQALKALIPQMMRHYLDDAARPVHPVATSRPGPAKKP